MKRISAVLITYNEEDKIERALQSLQDVSDEILIVDSYSTDATVEICRRYTARVMQRSWEGYRSQKQFATDQATHDWVLSLDGDEMLSPQLNQEIHQWKGATQEERLKGFLVPRKAYFMGRWIEHTTWYPDWQLRLFRKSCGKWKGGRVHESFHLAGSAGRFEGQIHHQSYSCLSEYLEQLENFSSLAARDSHDGGERARLFHLIAYPPAVFLKNYVLKLGFLDGVPGLIVSALAAVSTLFKYLKLWELQSHPRTHFDDSTWDE